MDNILEFSGKWGIYPPVSLWEEAVTVGKGRSWGLETEVSWSDETPRLLHIIRFHGVRGILRNSFPNGITTVTTTVTN